MDVFSRYLDYLLHLRQGNQTAPHKPVLLLSIFDLIEEQQIAVNQIPIDKKLFQWFERNWNWFAANLSGYKADITQPLYYLSDGLGWQLIGKQGNVLERRIRSKRKLEEEVAYGRFNEDFFQLLQNREYLDFFRWAMIDYYFGDTTPATTVQERTPLSMQELEQWILEEPQAVYQTKTVQKETSGFLRHQGFKLKVRKVYDFTCCMSGWRIETNPMMIDACHIQDHAHSGIDVIHNGIALCPSLHRAFDGGLISVDIDFKILVAHQKYINENATAYSLQELKGKKLFLPKEEKFWPSQEYVEWHRAEKFQIKIIKKFP